jgi:hypothetical protein
LKRRYAYSILEIFEICFIVFLKNPEYFLEQCQI